MARMLKSMPGFFVSRGMSKRPTVFRPSHLPTRAEQNRSYDKHRGSARERGYNTRWDKARRTFLGRHPLCVMCEGQGRVTAASVVDHIVPHRGDQTLFWDTANWQSLCKPHHDRDKQRADGRPKPS
jgi:5-methylcytosine-specific restriction protein A